MPLPWALAQRETQDVLCRIWTQVVPFPTIIIVLLGVIPSRIFIWMRAYLYGLWLDEGGAYLCTCIYSRMKGIFEQTKIFSSKQRSCRYCYMDALLGRWLNGWMEKYLTDNYTRMLRAILNKSCGQHPTKKQLYGHLPPITKTIKVRRTRHVGYCWRSRDELISDVLQWTPAHGRAKEGQPARTYIQQLCEDTGSSPEDLIEAMKDREEWRERVKDIRAGGTTWGWMKILIDNKIGERFLGENERVNVLMSEISWSLRDYN